jgi:GxxExxY protein
LELVYQTALGLEFQTRGIPYQAEMALPVKYKGELLMCSYRADFVCFDNIVIETKAIAKLTGADDAQIINELKATGFQRGILLNFGSSSLEYRRLVFGAPANLRKSVQSVDDFSL